MLKRRIGQRLKEWKDTAGHNPVIIKGCRQCGKTFSVLDFAKKSYGNVVYINFFETPAYSSIFSGSLAVDDLTVYMSAVLGSDAKFVPNDTCIILDELQECPNARTALKFFKIDGRYDVICTGSLLGLDGYRSGARSVPVGYETIINMYPLDFGEFLWACGINDNVTALLKNCLKNEIPVPEPVHEKMRELLLRYVAIGGMPAVVSAYLESGDMNTVLQMQRDIIGGYEDDMVKYASTADKGRIRDCFRSIPAQLAKEYKKFQYSGVRKGAGAKDYAGCLQWIEDAGIIRRCHNLRITELPLEGNTIWTEFKVYMSDIGLLTAMLEEGSQRDIVMGSLHGYKGAIFENLMADILGKAGHKLYYFRKESGLELDFIIRQDGECIPLEAKASTGNAKSLKTVLSHPEKYHISKAIKFGDYNIGRSGTVLTLPLYMAYFLG